MNQDLEVGVIYRPMSRREAAEMVINRDRAVQQSRASFANLSRNEEYLLVDLSGISASSDLETAC